MVQIFWESKNKNNLENIEVICGNCDDDGGCDDDSPNVMERGDLIAVYKNGNKVVVMSQRSE